MSSVQRPISRSRGERCRGLKAAARETRRQYASSAARAPSAPPFDHPSTSTAAFMAPADVPGDRLDLDPWLFEQAVEDPPGERAMRAAALQGEVDKNRLALVALSSIADSSHQLRNGYGLRGFSSARDCIT